MKTRSSRNLRRVALFIAVVFGMMLTASPAFCWDRHYSRFHHPSAHVRVVGHGSAVGAIIATGIIAGLTFSLLDSAARAPAPRCVTAPPQPVYGTGAAAPYSASTGSVIVTAQLLNVRSGPSLANPSIRQIPNGTVLSIQGNAPGWYFVRTSDNLTGWVMSQYTAPLGYSAAG